MDLTSPNLKLSYLAPAQAQKHVTHNEALRQLDALVQLSVISVSNTPAPQPQNGDRYIIGPSPEGVFGDNENDVAAFQDGAWTYFTPQIGWRAYVLDIAGIYIFNGENWSLPANGAIDVLGVNASADSINRLTVKSQATLLDHEGAGHQLKLNKALPSETASILFQTNYASQAELGLAGDNNLHLKVSHDGNAFKDSVIINKNTGSVTFPHGSHTGKIGSSVEASGGSNFHYGVPSVSVTYFSRVNLTLVQSRIYFCPMYIDRPTKIIGGFIAQQVASSTSGAVIRAGIYKLGTASGNDWEIGTRVVDFGASPADVAGHKDFELSDPIIFEAGWYACAVGTDGAGVLVRNVRTFQSGQAFLEKLGSCLLYTSPSPRDRTRSRMPSSA